MSLRSYSPLILLRPAGREALRARREAARDGIKLPEDLIADVILIHAMWGAPREGVPDP